MGQVLLRLLQKLGHPLQVFIERPNEFLVQPRISTGDPKVLNIFRSPSQQTEEHFIVGSSQWGRRPFWRGLLLQPLDRGGEETGALFLDIFTDLTEALLHDGVRLDVGFQCGDLVFPSLTIFVNLTLFPSVANVVIVKTGDEGRCGREIG